MLRWPVGRWRRDWRPDKLVPQQHFDVIPNPFSEDFVIPAEVSFPLGTKAFGLKHQSVLLVMPQYLRLLSINIKSTGIRASASGGLRVTWGQGHPHQIRTSLSWFQNPTQLSRIRSIGRRGATRRISFQVYLGKSRRDCLHSIKPWDVTRLYSTEEP